MMATQPLASFAVLVELVAAFLGFFFGLYALLTRKQRRTTREIREFARERGWRYRKRRWQGNPTAFRIDGVTQGGMVWVLTSGNGGVNEVRWAAELVLDFPALAGEPDFAILPRETQSTDSVARQRTVPAATETRVAAFSSTLASAIGFLQGAREFPTGVLPFDERYEVLALPSQQKPPVGAPLAEQILRWPAESIAPHSILAWRDPFGFHLKARLPAPPNSFTVLHFVGIAETCTAAIPPSAKEAAPSGLLDGLLARFLAR